MTTESSYPAVLVISRRPTERTPYPKVVVDKLILNDAIDVAARLDDYHKVEMAYRTTGLYTYTAVPLEDAEAVAAEIRAELEAESKAGDAGTPPAQTPPQGAEATPAQDTTEPAACQTAAIVVRYKGIPPLPTEAKVTGMLLQAEGIERGHSVYQQRIILEEHGYKPDYSQWAVLDRGGKDVRRREVYVRPAPVDEPAEKLFSMPPSTCGPIDMTGIRRVTQEELDEMRRKIAEGEAYRQKHGYTPSDRPATPRQLGWSYS